MELQSLKDKKITVLGLGLHGGGVGVVKFLAKYGAKVIVTDIKTKEQLKASLDKLVGIKNVEYVLGQHRTEDFTKVDLVVKNPGAPWTNKHIKLALEHHIPVEIDSSLFFKLCKNPIIGVTGTKGKTTTASLIYDILRLAGRPVVKVGIGQISVLDKLESLRKDSVVVFELSSWRLSALGRAKLSPKVAVMTNVFPDHLNYYPSMDEYFTDKKFIFQNQKPKDWLVINGDQELLAGVADEAPSQVIRFSSKPPLKKQGVSVFLDNGDIYLNNGIDEKRVVSVANLNVKGEHNLPNVMAAIGAAYASGIELPIIRKAIMAFTCIPHRLEFVREHKGINYFNDTAATIPDAAVAALQAFTEPVILIAGGSDKKLDLSQFAKEIFERAKGIVFLKGDATDRLLDEIRKQFPEDDRKRSFEVVNSMKKAVEFASQIAEKGDVVLLSPGAASFGMFDNEFDRGDKFREAVSQLR